MASPTKTRRLPAWASGSIPQRAQPTGIKTSKQPPQQEQSASYQQQFDDITENANSPSTGDISQTLVESGPNSVCKLLEGVIFTISGLVNPERTDVRKMALDMGADYRPSWSADSTLLVCPFANTPTFNQVQASGGTIVHKDWITTCYNQKELVPIEPYMLHVGKPWKTGSALDESTDIGVAAAESPSPKPGEGARLKSTVKGGRESQTGTSPKNASKQHVNPRGAGMEYRHVNQTSGALNNLASPVDVQQWVLEDLAATLTWLEQQNDRPDEHELEAVAAQGLLVCLQDAVRSLQENQGLSMVMDNWAFIPRAVRELAVYEKGGHALNEQLIAEGERFKVIYESQLKKLGFGTPSVHGESRDTKTYKGESRPAGEIMKSSPIAEADKDVDDDATEIMSDADSRDAADFDSDGTEELDEGEVAVCKENILQTFGLD